MCRCVVCGGVSRVVAVCKNYGGSDTCIGVDNNFFYDTSDG